MSSQQEFRRLQRSQQDSICRRRILVVLGGFYLSQQGLRGHSSILGKILEVFYSILWSYQDLVGSGFQRIKWSQQDFSLVVLTGFSRVSGWDFRGQQDFIYAGFQRYQQLDFNQDFRGLSRSQRNLRGVGRILEDSVGFQRISEVLVGFQKNFTGLSRILEDGILVGFSRILEVLDFRSQQDLRRLQMSQQDLVGLTRILEVLVVILEVLV